MNTSLEEGMFASDWKTAMVTPLLKKIGLELIHLNYRPVPNLTFLSKCLEQCALTQYNDHCRNHNLTPDYQSAYRENYSCETALIKIVDDILWSMENGKVTSLMALDLLVAFDTVDHEILLRVLQRRYGKEETCLDWFNTYLRPRFYKVNVGKAYSKECNLYCSALQGSCMGPGLYLAYVSSLQDITARGMPLHGLAGDHSVKKSFCADRKKKET